MLVSVKHSMGKAAIKLAYGTKDVTGVAYDSKLSKKVSVYGLWADGSAMSIGMVAKF